MSCPRKQKCPLFPHLKMSLEIWKTRFCDSPDYEICERYRIGQQGGRAPENMLPDGQIMRKLGSSDPE